MSILLSFLIISFAFALMNTKSFSKVKSLIYSKNLFIDLFEYLIPLIHLLSFQINLLYLTNHHFLFQI